MIAHTLLFSSLLLPLPAQIPPTLSPSNPRVRISSGTTRFPPPTATASTRSTGPPLQDSRRRCESRGIRRLSFTSRCMARSTIASSSAWLRVTRLVPSTPSRTRSLSRQALPRRVDLEPRPLSLPHSIPLHPSIYPPSPSLSFLSAVLVLVAVMVAVVSVVVVMVMVVLVAAT
jgi:hypothetical protein